MDRRRFVTAAGATAAGTLALTTPASARPASASALPAVRRRGVRDARYRWFRVAGKKPDGVADVMPAQDQQRR